MKDRLAILRKFSAENGHLGSPECRDSSIRAFLDEIGRVVCSAVLDNMEDGQLGSLYAKWGRAIRAGVVDEDERHAWLASGVHIMLIPYEVDKPKSPEESTAPNVVTLTRR